MANKIRVSAYRRKSGVRVRSHPRRAPTGKKARATRSDVAAAYAALYSISRPVITYSATDLCIAQIDQFVGSGWGAQIRQRLISHAGKKAWAKLERGWSVDRCQYLAELANKCDQLARWGGKLNGWGDLTDQAPVAGLLIHLNPVGQKLHQAANLLRLTGVIICYAKGQQRRCACRKALVVGFNADTGLVVQAMCAALNALPILPATR